MLGALSSDTTLTDRTTSISCHQGSLMSDALWYRCTFALQVNDKNVPDTPMCEAAYGSNVVMGLVSAAVNDWSYSLALDPGAGEAVGREWCEGWVVRERCRQPCVGAVPLAVPPCIASLYFCARSLT